MGRIFIVGDIHGEYDITTLVKLRKNQKLTKEDTVVQVGDFGLIFHPRQSPTEKFWLNWIEKNIPCKLFWIDGNHENFTTLWTFPIITLPEGEVRQIRSNIFYLQRGHFYRLGGKNFFAMGGGISIDKDRRIEGVSWWKDEEPSFSEWKTAFDNIDKWTMSEPVYVLSHDLPDAGYDWMNDLWHGQFYKERNSVSKGLEEVRKRLNYLHWYCGHMHEDITNPDLRISILFRDPAILAEDV